MTAVFIVVSLQYGGIGAMEQLLEDTREKVRP